MSDTFRLKASFASVAVLAALAVVAGASGMATGATTAETLFGSTTPTIPSDTDTASVTLGTKITVKTAGKVTAVRFYKGSGNSGTHVGALYANSGALLTKATFVGETASGWQSINFATPQSFPAGAVFTVALLAPRGRYAVANTYGWPRRSASLTATAGTYHYGTTITYPTDVYRSSNYYVDVSFTPTATSTPSPSQSPTVTTSPSPSQPPTTGTGVLQLPRIAWEGGTDYYKQFSGSQAFANPNLFPIGIWWGDFDSDANVKWDKDHGINFYTQLNGTEDGQLIVKNDMYLIQGANDQALVKNIPFTDPHWAGWWLSDETDGKYDPPSAGHAAMQRQIDKQSTFCTTGTNCKFAYANYTGIVTSYYNAAQVAADEKYVNMFDGSVSVDGYYYTDPSCADPNRHDYQVNAPDNAHCRTSAAYGNFITNLRTRDASDGKLKPLWGFVENGAPTGTAIYITPQQAAGAVWSMIRHEARGLVWFNQSFSGSCQSGNVIRSAQADPTGCNAARVAGMKTVNSQVQALAPVLNTQSFVWDFQAAGAETMLKVKDGSAYIFAGVALNSNPGLKTFTLPSGVRGSTVEVVGENRTLAVAGSKFTDNFAAESTSHIYRVVIS